MINKIWCFFIIISLFFSVINGNLENLNQSVFSSINDTTQMLINMFGSMCFWCGMIKIISETSLLEELEKMNTNSQNLSDEMILFIAINTASLQIIPTNVIAIRNSLNSNNPSGIIIAVWFSSIMTFISIIVLTKLYLKIRRN